MLCHKTPLLPLHLPHLSRTARLSIVISISAAFFVAEISVGFYTHSLALIADAFHYLNDLVGLLIALTAIRITKRGSSPKGFSFGWQRAQLLGAFFNGVFLAALGLSIFLQALERFVNVAVIERPRLVLVVGAVGLGLNILSVLFVHEHGHSHGHGHGHGHGHSHSHGTAAVRTHSNDTLSSQEEQPTASPRPRPERDLGMLGVLIHLLGDALNNIAVIGAASAIIWSKSPARYYADPAISMAISLMIALTSIPLMKNSAKILLQSSPVDIDIAEVKKDLEGLPGILSVHELHIWSLDQKKRVASAHVVVETEGPGEGVMDRWPEKARRVGERLHAWGVHSYTLQPEPEERKGGEVVRVSAMDGGGDLEAGRRGRGEVGADGEMNEAGRREVGCKLQCEDETCRDLQCCQ